MTDDCTQVHQKTEHSKFVVQRKSLHGTWWESHAYPPNDEGEALKTLAWCREQEKDRMFKATFRLVKITTEVYSA